MFFGGWFNARFGLGKEINTIPFDDLKPHEPGMQCWCNPFMRDDGIVSHASMDGREDFENGVRLPS